MTGIFLQVGAHETLAEGACAMEFAAWVAGEPHSDHPACVCPVIAAFLRNLNDRLPDADRQRLIPVVLDSIGTRTTRADERTRAFLVAGWAVRVAAPIGLRAVGRHAAAARLEALAPVTDRASARAADVYAAAYAAYAAYAHAAYAAPDLLDSALDLVCRMCAVGRRDVPIIEERVAQLRAAAGQTHTQEAV